MPSDPRDANFIPSLAGEDSTNSSKTAVVAVNPSTNAVIVQLA